MDSPLRLLVVREFILDEFLDLTLKLGVSELALLGLTSVGLGFRFCERLSLHGRVLVRIRRAYLICKYPPRHQK